MNRIIGYTRELPRGAGMQADANALRAAGATRVVTERVDARGAARPRLAELIQELRSGDTLLVSRAARVSHSQTHFTSLLTALTERGVYFQSLSEPTFNTEHPVSSGLEMVAALELLRRELLSLHTRSGLDDAAGRGAQPGRPTVMTHEKIEIARELRQHSRSYAHIAKIIGVSPGAVRRALAG